MREILSISIPGETLLKIKQRVKARGFDSVSGYIKYLIQEDDDLISADELLEMAKEARKEYKEGRTIKAKSLDDLI